jgi:phosphoribosylformimino-5-aminoimidazole carboxamide ribotide isomerase
MLSGPNVAAIEQMAVETGKSVIASGGVSSLEDLTVLQALFEKGVTGAIVGKALYEGRFTVSEALNEVKA